MFIKGDQAMQRTRKLMSGPASRIAQVSQQTIRNWADHAGLRHEITSGGYRLFDPDDLDAFIELRRQKDR